MGRVLRVSVKARTPDDVGLPKHSVGSARIELGGLVGDFNRYRHDQLADDPDSAVLLVPNETLANLVAEGWPVAPGDLGENLTTEGIPYPSMRPGGRLRVGEALIQVTRACEPCTNLYRLPYVGTAKGPSFLKAMVGRRGWYARVLRPGLVCAGDAIDLEGGGTS